MAYSPAVRELMESLRCLPGVGPKSAQRMTFALLQHDRSGANRLARALQTAAESVGECRLCRNLTEADLCPLCASDRRDPGVLCIVENPSDVQALEDATDYGGLYFVLGGRLSPLDGIGPGELGLERLETRLSAGEVREIILAVSPTVEGEATAQYIAGMASDAGVDTARIAHGVPLGGDLDYVDAGTLSHAFAGRAQYR